MTRDLGFLPDEERCTAFASTTQDRCKRPRNAGLTVCTRHGGGTDRSRQKSAIARVEKAVVRRGYGKSQVGVDHVGASPISGLAWEIRRTAFNIETVGEKLSELHDEQLVYGTVSVSVRRDLEEEIEDLIGPVDEEPVVRQRSGSYTLRQEAARLHLWAELQLRERKHYAELLKLAFSANFEDRRVRLIESQVADLNGVITSVLRRLGHDPHSADVRAIVREEIMRVMPVPA